MRVFLDTNVVIAAFAAEGSSRAVFRHVLRGALDGVVSAQVIAETSRNLAKLKRIDAARRDLVVRVVEEICEVVRTPRRPRRVSRDADDDAILAAAVSAKVDVLVTGDQDLLVIPRKIARVAVLSPSELLRRIERP